MELHPQVLVGGQQVAPHLALPCGSQPLPGISSDPEVLYPHLFDMGLMIPLQIEQKSTRSKAGGPWSVLVSLVMNLFLFFLMPTPHLALTSLLPHCGSYFSGWVIVRFPDKELSGRTGPWGECPGICTLSPLSGGTKEPLGWAGWDQRRFFKCFSQFFTYLLSYCWRSLASWNLDE